VGYTHHHGQSAKVISLKTWALPVGKVSDAFTSSWPIGQILLAFPKLQVICTDFDRFHSQTELGSLVAANFAVPKSELA